MNQGIMSPLADDVNVATKATCDNGLSNDSNRHSSRHENSGLGRPADNDLDADLKVVMDAWKTLSPAVKATILAAYGTSPSLGSFNPALHEVQGRENKDMATEQHPVGAAERDTGGRGRSPRRGHTKPL
jgi:hypothetical protein